MTNHEAVEILNRLSEAAMWVEDGEEVIMALGLGIEALLGARPFNVVPIGIRELIGDDSGEH